MEEPRKLQPVVVAGYAVGVGAVFTATAGVYWHFWRPELATVVWLGGSFAIGAALGAIYAAWRRVQL